jgi:transcriptional regulator with XRE-family HTH domain
MDRNAIGEKIKDLRKSQGITQQGLAESSGCTRQIK